MGTNEIQLANCKDEISKALRSISYGLFIISSVKDGKINGQAANTVFQITSDPVTLAIGINKNNLTHEYINSSKVFSVGVLNTEGLSLVRNFGFRSGRDADKFDGIEYETSETGAPLLKDSLASFECKVVGSMDLGTHTLFIGEVICAQTSEAGEPMTYALYHKIKNRPTAQSKDNVTKWVCKVCGYVHEGDQPPAQCPVCGVGPEEFEKLE